MTSLDFSGAVETLWLATILDDLPRQVEVEHGTVDGHLITIQDAVIPIYEVVDVFILHTPVHSVQEPAVVLVEVAKDLELE